MKFLKDISTSKKKLVENYERIIFNLKSRMNKLNKEKDSLEIKIKKLESENEMLLIENKKISDSYIEKSKEAHALKQSKDILDEMTDELIKEIEILTNKKIKRLEHIKSRTRKVKTKKKLENAILKIEKRYI